MATPWWLDRPGLAGGIDKSGERAAELLGLGFGSVEFGSVTVRPLAECNPGLDALLARLATQRMDRLPGAVDREKGLKTAIGIGLGLPPTLPPEQLADEWLAGLRLLAEAPPVADYVSLNLSAAANRRFVGVELQPWLLAALAAVARFRQQQAPAQRPQLAVKLPVDAAPGLWPALLAAGVGQLTAVLPEDAGRFDSLARLRRLLAAAETAEGGPALVAVGGIVHASSRQQALAAGAQEIQVHRLFTRAGAATPELLLPIAAMQPAA